MRIKRRRFIVTVLILLAAGMFLPETLLKTCLERYFRTRIGGQCAIERISFSYNNIAAYGIHLKHKYFRADIEKLKIDFTFPEFIKPQLKLITVSNANINIESLAHTQAELKKLIASSREITAKPAAVSGKELLKYFLALDTISLALREKDLYLNSNFSFDGAISAQAPLLEFKRFKVDNFKLSKGNVSCAFRIEPAGDNRYTLYIDSLKREDQEIKNISLPLEVAEDNIVVKESPFVFLGPASSIEGLLELFDFEHFCFKVFLRTATFTNVVKFLGQQANITFEGPFNGELRLCWEKGKFCDISGVFSAIEEGVINIRKEVSFDFLKKYLDEESYKALIDSFNNYSYNNGTLTVGKQANTISIHFDFNSQQRGRRNVFVNFHMDTGQ